ncbi:ribbon-helix-helix domain-containing protein [Breoghania sp. L-A4]|uniref:ribbon-helix-helix domain-containing protein n=1 Tax=Breoghania sp. L-A4 TaxID=2304600 RepID=UPI000E35F2D3|nr:ribbon-helix-helix domain-containing protein [Breoghania sp. L-A4]AXS42671.1 aryl-sulfate sulfotransferase [Breoghania sp. L-A4]
MTLKKRSLTLRGHRTSLALEREFWSALDEIAQARKMPVAALIAEIDDARAEPSALASAVRVAILAHYRERQ